MREKRLVKVEPLRKGVNTMSQTKGGNGAIATNDLLADLADDEPIARKPTSRESQPFVANPALIEAIAGAFSRTGAMSVKRVFPTEKDAKSSCRVYLLHALEVAQGIEGKSAALRVVPITKEYAAAHDWAAKGVGQWRATVQLTHERRSKDEIAAAAETPAANETPAETPAQ